jgi:uncharacterized protein YbjT (DUF2867 family)
VQAGVEVVALVRKEESKTELDKMPGVTAVLGNALEAADVIGVLDGCDACVSTLGGESAGVRVDYKGNMNAIENAVTSAYGGVWDEGWRGSVWFRFSVCSGRAQG